jgi:hypothetical protein
MKYHETFDLSTLCITIPQSKQKDILIEVAQLCFIEKN